MELLERHLEKASNELAEAEAELARAHARVEGLRAERDSLGRAVAAARATASGAEPTDADITAMPKGEAIVTVLRKAKPRALSNPEIVDALREAGRTREGSRTISVYLDGLLKEARVLRVARGAYTVPD
jgi:hypothetical protein